jgi:hypothetical protein
VTNPDGRQPLDWFWSIFKNRLRYHVPIAQTDFRPFSSTPLGTMLQNLSTHVSNRFARTLHADAVALPDGDQRC